MKSKKIIAIISLLCLSLNNVVYADVNEDVIKAQQEYQVYQDKIDKLTGEIIKINSVIEGHLASIEENNQKIESLNKDIKNSEKLVKELKEKIVSREELKDNRLREYYKTDPLLSYLTVILTSDNLMDIINNIDNISKIIDMDRSIIDDITRDKEIVDSEISKQEESKIELKNLNKEIKSKMVEVESVKQEQEKILKKLKVEQEVFGKEVLEVAEMNSITPQSSIINDSSSDLNSLRSAVVQLTTMRDNQIKTDRVKSEINNLINLGQDRIKELTIINPPSTSDINRGPFTGTGSDIVNFAYQFIGKAYVWGAVGPETFDCSGLTSYVYRHAANMEITRTTYTQINVGTTVSQSELQPGDLVFTYSNEHVGIYVGNGMYINATYPGSTVRVTPVTNFYAARRYL